MSLVLPLTYGRLDLGMRSTMVIQDSVITASTPLAASSRPIRARRGPALMTRDTLLACG